jgi:RimJ/RimL family protein N-acetyltransferase
MLIFKSKRLLFRHLELGDLDDLYALYSDPEMRRYFPDGTLSREATREELEWFLDGHPKQMRFEREGEDEMGPFLLYAVNL